MSEQPPTGLGGSEGPGEPQYGQPQYGQPQYGQPQYGQPQYGQPQYGQPQYGQPQYGQPQYGQPQYGQPQYGQPQYGQPQYGQPQYGAPGQPPGPGGPNRGRLLALIVVGLLVLGGIVTAAVLSNSSDDAPRAISSPSFPTSAISVPSISVPSISVPSIPTTGVSGIPDIGQSTATLAALRFYLAVNSHDLSRVNGTACSGSSLGVTQAQLDKVGVVLPLGTPVVSGSTAKSVGKVDRTDSSSASVSLSLRQNGQSWCVASVSGL